MPEASYRWQRSSLEGLTVKAPNVNPADTPDSVFTYIDISSIDNQNHVIAWPHRISGRDAPSRARLLVQEGDVLFSNVRTHLRNVAQVIEVEYPALASTGFTLLRASGAADSRFLFHLVRSRYFLSLVSWSESGTHYPATSAQKVRSLEVSVPTVEAQSEIAAS